MSRFLIVPYPEKDESISSYILRLSAENKYEKAKWVFECLNLVKSHAVNHLYNCNSDHPSLTRLANMTGLDLEVIKGMTFLPWLGDYNNSDSLIDATLGVNIHRLNIKFCPDCLKENLYYKKVWDLRQYNVCHFHRGLLIDRCDSCQRKIFIKPKNDISRCICGKEYRNMETSYLFENGLERFIYEKMYQGVSTNNNHLYSMELKDALFIITSLSSKFLHNTFKKAEDFIEYRNNIMLEVFKAFEDFPNSFYAFLYNYYIKFGSKSNGFKLTEQDS